MSARNWEDLMKKRATPIDSLIGRRLRALRVERGLSQTQVADHLGVAFQQVQKYETGANRVASTRLLQYGNLYGLTVAQILEGIGQPGTSTRLSDRVSTLQASKLLDCYEAMSSAQRVILLQLAELMLRA